MIKVNIASKNFGKTAVLRDIQFEVATGETVAIVGRSGIGKSTLLRLIAGTDTNFTGTINCSKSRSFVFQEPTLLPWRTTLQNITLVHETLSISAARDALARVGIAGKDDMFPGQLSLGQQRRLSLARAFAGRPEVLIMDEPFVSLDSETANEMLSLTEKLIRDTRPATVFVTHSEDEAHRLGDRILKLSGSPATLL
ncbi:ABC transporter ATP-binding protein [Pararhizobium sp. IMCC21322]|uniref:ABC transporter ATP-binding protein n=1 Tax=Pararhizobium sp. IMCC21322 TaxID=3067903 RepID=UPI00274061FC|nr:ABC transporter ATP-binding protein [Pararhizobium sp. IMCC21322]